MAEGRNLIAIRHGSNLSQAFEDGKRPIENFELGFDANNGVLYIGVNNTYQAVGANFGKDVVLTAENGGTGQKIDPEEGKIVFSYFDQNGGQIVETSTSGTLYTIKEEDKNGNSSITVMHGILPPAVGGTGLSEILPNSFVYGGADGNLVSIAPGKNTEGDTEFNAGVPIFERDDSNQTNSVKTGIVPLQFGGLGENFRNSDIKLGLFYLTSTTPENNDVANRVFRTLKNPDDYSLLSFTDKLEWLQPPFIQKDPELDSNNAGELMIYAGPTDGKDYFTTIDTFSGSSSGFLCYEDSSYTFRSIKEKDIVDLGKYLTSDDLNLNNYQLKIDATGILVGDGESVSSVTVDTSITGNTYLSYSGGKYSFQPIETGPKISGTGLLYAVSGADTSDQVEIKGASFPEVNSLVFVEKDGNNNMGITYHSTLPLSYYDIPLEGQGDIKNGNDDVWSFIWGKYEVSNENSPPKLIELSSWGPKEDTEGAVTKFLGLDKNNNFYWTSSLPTTTLVLPSNLKYAESGTASSIVGIVNGTDQFIKVDFSSLGKSYTAVSPISIDDASNKISLVVDRGAGYIWRDIHGGLTAYTTISGVTIGEEGTTTNPIYTYFDTRYVDLTNIAPGSGNLLLINSDDKIVESNQSGFVKLSSGTVGTVSTISPSDLGLTGNGEMITVSSEGTFVLQAIPSTSVTGTGWVWYNGAELKGYAVETTALTTNTNECYLGLFKENDSMVRAVYEHEDKDTKVKTYGVEGFVKVTNAGNPYIDTNTYVSSDRIDDIDLSASGFIYIDKDESTAISMDFIDPIYYVSNYAINPNTNLVNPGFLWLGTDGSVAATTNVYTFDSNVFSVNGWNIGLRGLASIPEESDGSKMVTISSSGFSYQDIPSGGGASYTAGSGINISDSNEISVGLITLANLGLSSNSTTNKMVVANKNGFSLETIPSGGTVLNGTGYVKCSGTSITYDNRSLVASGGITGTNFWNKTTSLAWLSTGGYVYGYAITKKSRTSGDKYLLLIDSSGNIYADTVEGGW